ncbi:MAG TPA: TonB-dependent receptor [Flavobacteriales bacterium]
MKKLTLAVAALLAGNLLLSQTDSLQERMKFNTQLPEVQYTSEKRLSGTSFGLQARNSTVISSEMIAQLPVTTVQEVLQYITGVDLRQRGPMGGQADLTIMGSTFEQVLVLVNGIPMRDPQTGHNQMNLPVSIQQIERIEVMMGSASRIYGANAMAGAINIITKEPGKETVYVQAYAGSNFQSDTSTHKDYYLTGGQASLGFNTGKSGHQLDISFIETNGYKYNSQNSQQRLNYTGSIGIGQGKLDVFAGGVMNDFGANNFYAAPGDKEAVETIHTLFGGLKYVQTLGKWTLRPIVYTRYNYDDYIYTRLKPEVYRNKHYTTAGGAEFHARRTNSFGALGLGIESRVEYINSSNLGEHQRNLYALYADQRFQIDERVQFTVGANMQYSSDYGWKFYPGVEFSALLHPSLTAYANSGLSNRLPTYTDLYYTDNRANIGNAELKPESAINLEGGLKWSRNGWYAHASGFARQSHDFIDFVRADDTLMWQPQNFSNVLVRGVDIRAQYTMRERGTAFDLSSFSAGITYLDAQYDAGNLLSKYALEHLRWQMIGRVTLKTTNYFSHTITGRYVERFQAQEFGLLDYRLRFHHKHFGAYFDITNIFDRSYIESGVVEMPGRWFRLGVEFKLLSRKDHQN